MAGMENVLVTGAAGGIGTWLRTQLLRGVYPRIRWSDLRTPADLDPNDEFIAADLSDYPQVEKIVAGMDGIVHLGAVGQEGAWDAIHQANITGCYNLFEAAYRAGVKRIVFASTAHVVGFYPRHQRIGTDAIVRPDSRYGASKAFGEALGALYADKHGLRVTCLRIGNLSQSPKDKRRLSIWIRPDDFVSLVRIGLEHPDIRYEIFYGVSDNDDSWWDNRRARQFGYRPKGRAHHFRRHALAQEAKLPADPVANYFQGGPFASDEYDAGPVERDSPSLTARVAALARWIARKPRRAVQRIQHIIERTIGARGRSP